MSWTLWGDGSEPIKEDLTEDQARKAVADYAAAGRHEVYAENEDGDVIE